MFVLTIDQQGSRVHGDRVDALLSDLTPHVDGRPGLVRLPERTVGDEVQLLASRPDLVVQVALQVLRWGGWSVGIGAGPVDEPLPASARAGSGPAFVHAREAVEAAKQRSRVVPLAVRGSDVALAGEAEAVLLLIGATAARRTTAGWEVVDAIGAGDREVTQEEVAGSLGVSQQAVSQRLRAALWQEERAARPAAARLLRLAEVSGQDGLAASADADRGPTGPGEAAS